MARWERHLFDLANVPGTDHQPATVGILVDLLDDFVALVDGTAIGSSPIAPLGAIDTAEIALGVGPFVPDSHAVLVEIFDVGIAAEKPEQFVDDRFEMELLRGEEWKACVERKAGLRAENGISAGACSVGFEFALLENEREQIKVWLHQLAVTARSS